MIALGMGLAGSQAIIMLYRMGEIAKSEQHRDKKHDGRIRLHSITDHGGVMLSEGIS